MCPLGGHNVTFPEMRAVARGEALCDVPVPGLVKYPKTRRLAPLVYWCLHVSANITLLNVIIL